MSTTKQKSLHGTKAYVGINGELIASAHAGGGVNKPTVVIPGSPDIVAIFDDFIGDTGRALDNTDANWRVFNGDTGGTSVISLQNATGGILRLAPGANPVDQVKFGVGSSISWKGNQGSIPTDGKAPVRMSARVRAASYQDTGNSTCNFWIGFTDTNVAETPVIDTGGAIVSVASNAVGIGFSSKGQGDTGLVGYAVNGDADATPVVLKTDYTAGQFVTVEVAIHHGISDTGGTATFYVDGEAKGSIPSPVAMNVGLSPQVLFWGDTGGGYTFDIDYVNVSGPRDTGL